MFLSLCLLLVSLNLAVGNYEPICNPTLGYCARFYNQTKLPNMFYHTDYTTVFEIQKAYDDLAASECHPHVDLLICSTLYPACTTGFEITKPCHHLCRQVKNSCRPFLAKVGLDWPWYFNCNGLPRKKRGRFCIDEGFTVEDLEKIRPPDPPDEQPGTDEGEKKQEEVEEGLIDTATEQEKEPVENFHYSDRNEIENFGLQLLKTEPQDRRSIRTYKACSEPVLFQPSERDLSRMVLMVGSGVALSLSILSLALASAHGKLEKPEHIVTVLNTCFLIQTLGHFISAIIPQAAFQCSVQEGPSDPLYLKIASPSPLCLLTFSLTYVTSLAANLWWVTLNLLWFLMLGMAWRRESLFNVSRYLHLVIGLLSVGLTLTVILVGAVQGDDLSGACVAGGVDAELLATYELTPTCVLLAVGTVVLLCGTWTLVKVSRLDGVKQELPVRRLRDTALFSYLYLLVSGVRILCQFYELSHREEWYRNCDPLRLVQESPTQDPTSSDSSLLAGNSSSSVDAASCGPDSRLFLAKYTCNLLLPVLVAGYLLVRVAGVRLVIPLAKTFIPLRRSPSETKV